MQKLFCLTKRQSTVIFALHSHLSILQGEPSAPAEPSKAPVNNEQVKPSPSGKEKAPKEVALNPSDEDWCQVIKYVIVKYALYRV